MVRIAYHFRDCPPTGNLMVVNRDGEPLLMRHGDRSSVVFGT